ncbi:hypothetical protein D2V17_14085 [Aurantiacibacter xanthus]|uniref:Uncharacterized protein n=1 Tax=Aurantiacibacter xanthus TaxID=1784712 RepID=A0A3A1P5R8_9SPHN|nr:hypothetical protein D2V17_14085 [Aurantiacibacter xanthus]
MLVPALGSMPKLARLIGEEWVQLYDGEPSGKRLADFAAHLRSWPGGAQPNPLFDPAKLVEQPASD